MWGTVQAVPSVLGGARQRQPPSICTCEKEASITSSNEKGFGALIVTSSRPDCSSPCKSGCTSLFSPKAHPCQAPTPTSTPPRPNSPNPVPPATQSTVASIPQRRWPSSAVPLRTSRSARTTIHSRHALKHTLLHSIPKRHINTSTTRSLHAPGCNGAPCYARRERPRPRSSRPPLSLSLQLPASPAPLVALPRPSCASGSPPHRPPCPCPVCLCTCVCATSARSVTRPPFAIDFWTNPRASSAADFDRPLRASLKRLFNHCINASTELNQSCRWGAAALLAEAPKPAACAAHRHNRHALDLTCSPRQAAAADMGPLAAADDVSGTACRCRRRRHHWCGRKRAFSRRGMGTSRRGRSRRRRRAEPMRHFQVRCSPRACAFGVVWWCYVRD